MRSCVIPTEEFRAIDLSEIRDSCEIFYKLFEELFGIENCSYNVHVVCSHILEIRTHGPLTETSAFKFESFYGEMRRSFVPGTISPLKQILKNVLLKRALSKHVFANNIFISNYDTPLESNKLIYCYEKKKYLIYEISDINDNELICHKVGQYPVTFDEIPSRQWSNIGVFRKGGTSSEKTLLKTSQIRGKVLLVGNYLLTCPINVLNEK